VTLQGQKAVITGASSGVGKAIALRLAREGAALVLIGRDLATLEAVARTARSKAPGVSCYQADLSADGAVEALLDRIGKEVGPVELLVHSAAAFALAPVEHAPVDQLDAQYRINLRAPYTLTRGLLPGIRARRGQIVFINSMAGLSARANVSQYAATKHALRALADSLRDEVNPDGVRVLSVFLGRTATPMQEAVHRLEGKPYHADRLLQPDDVAQLVVALLSLPGSAEVTDVSIRPLARPS
jgi:short-subunit dehydrogenase